MTISPEDVAAHNVPQDAWITFKGKVYNVTNFLQSHPGGSIVIEDYLGKDIQKAFEDVGHSAAALRMMDDYFVGHVAKGNEGRSASEGDHAKDGSPSGNDDDNKMKLHTELNWCQHGVNFSKALVPQIYSISAEQYASLVREPFCSTQVCTFFPSRLLEPLSRTYWWVVPLIWLPVSFMLFAKTVNAFGSALVAAELFIIGIFVWTFAEYMLHRFLFHFVEERLPDHGAARVCHFLAHAVHHLFPLDPLRLVMPPALFSLFCSPFWFFFDALLPTPFLRGVWAGVFFGYVAYDMIHFHSHHAIFENVSYLAEMKRYHMKHHFKQPEMGFGVSNKLWDFVFGTVLY